MEGSGASDEEAPPTNVRKKDLTKSQRLEAISILRVKYILMVVLKGVPLSTSPKGSMWHEPQFGDYGSGQHAHVR